MLIRLVARALIVGLVGLASAVSHSPVPAAAYAQTWVNCPSGEQPYIDQAVCPFGVGPYLDEPFGVDLPPGIGGGGCHRPNGTESTDPEVQRERGPVRIGCVHPEKGQYSSAWDCYLGPPQLHDVPDTNTPGYDLHGDDGIAYLASCFPPADNDYRVGPHWGPCYCGAVGPEAQWDDATLVVLPEVPEFDEDGPGLLEVWAEAVNQLEMHGPAVTTAPPLSAAGLVNLPVWLWTEVTEQTWPEQQHEFAVGGPWRVDVYAEPLQMEWDMGDGAAPTVCPPGSPGVPWTVELDYREPPAGACTHTYRRSSYHEPGRAFEIIAITTWLLWWEVNEVYDNEVEIQVGTTATYQVNELQVLTGR